MPSSLHLPLIKWRHSPGELPWLTPLPPAQTSLLSRAILFMPGLLPALHCPQSWRHLVPWEPKSFWNGCNLLSSPASSTPSHVTGMVNMGTNHSADTSLLCHLQASVWLSLYLQCHLERLLVGRLPFLKQVPAVAPSSGCMVAHLKHWQPFDSFDVLWNSSFSNCFQYTLIL